jgi:hypothetical protein
MRIESARPLLVALLLVLATALPAPTVSASAETRDFRFDVFLDGRRIGEHHFEVAGANGDERVRSRAEFEFRMLFVTLYRYRHAADEIWQAGCLTGLTSSTNDNGQTFAVEAAREEAGMLLTRLQPDRASREIATACPATFAYWDRERLQAGTLINTQTGEVANTRLVREGVEAIDGVETVRYRLEAEGLGDIHLWYRAADGVWWRLATRRDGRLLEYRAMASTSA